MNISALPHFSQLSKDYLGRFETSPLKQFFPLPPGTDGLTDFLSTRAKGFPQENRETIADLIQKQVHDLGLDTGKIEASITKLRSPRSLVIVTGQQVTLFGGPLYTIYKTATAIALARELQAKYPDHDFVPVFWLETEDHDIKEATATAVFNRSNDITHLGYMPDGFDTVSIEQNWKKQVGPYPFDAEPLEAALQQLTEALQPTEFTETLIGHLRESYRTGRTFAQAFSHWLYTLFAGQGLLILDANIHAAKALGKDLFLKELETSPKLSEKVVLQTVQLEEHYHAQVKPRAINLFYVEDGERFAILEKEKSHNEEGRSYFLKGTRRTFTQQELADSIGSHPERFSPNVLMRPLYQDTILPTVAYIGGPGEIAYFAQFKAAYDWAEIPMPVIYPRITATIIEEKYEKSAEKNGVTIDDLLVSGTQTIDRLLSSLADQELQQLFESLDKDIDATLEALRQKIEAIDKSLDQSLTTLKGKVLTPIRDFGAKVQAADKRRHQTVRDQLNRAITGLLPDGELQERVISPLYFLNKYGPGFLEGLLTRSYRDVLGISEHHLYRTTDLQASTENSQLSENLRTSERVEPFISATAIES